MGGGNQHCLNQWKHPLSIGQGIKWDDQCCSDSLTFLCSKKKSAGTNCNESTDCYHKDLKVKRYDGCGSTTASGKSCQAWASTVPHNHKYTHLSLEGNYCRTDDHTGPWCYTTDPNKRWEDCLVPICNEGCTIEQATDYFGWNLERGSKIKVTANIQECADYSASTPGSRFWTWSKTTKKCYPKSSKAGRQEAGIEVVSGNNRCANSGCGNDWEPYDDHCYYWSNNTKTWDEAEAFCQEENGHLASITSNAINQYVVEGMNSRGLRNTWMGGTDIDEEGTWKWRDGSPFIFTFWHSGEPNNQGGNQHCLNQWKHPLSIGQGIKWDDQRCSDSLTFLCSKKKSAGTNCNESTDCYHKDLKVKRYDGCVSTTASGNSCQAWASTVPHNHKYTHLSLEGNYCRTDDHTGPWCYTTDPNKRWEDCLVPICNEGCTIEQATDYFGWDLEGGSKIKVTANIQECADYSASTPGSRFWTWSKTTKKCYPKSSKAGRQEAGIEVVSGNNRCANSGCGNDWEP